ncbi:MAG: hypothetical protein DRP01_01075 [Archaeoglobales archaeon]|nr:MAG: hypothetical protein DRP01_01075 [Archaeoglobales archaeon]
MKILNDKELEGIFEMLQEVKDRIGIVRDHLFDLKHNLMAYHLSDALKMIDEVEDILFSEEER